VSANWPGHERELEPDASSPHGDGANPVHLPAVSDAQQATARGGNGVTPVGSTDPALAPAGPASLDEILARLDATLTSVEGQCTATNMAASMTRVLDRRRGHVYAAMDALGAWINAFLAGQPSDEEVRDAKARVTVPLRAWSQTGRVLDRTLAKLRGYPGDFEVLEILVDGKPSGASLRSRILDDYYLHTAGSNAIRNRQAHLAARLGEALHEEHDGGQSPVRMLSLGCGAARELTLLVDDPVFLQMTEVTCVDRDPDGLRYARKRLRKHLDGRVRYVRSDTLRLVRLPNRAHAGYHVIYIPSVLEFLPDDHVARLIAYCHGLLAPGGRLLACNLSARTPANECVLVEWLGDVQIMRRSEAQLRSIFAATPFGAAAPRFEYESLGISYLITAERAA